MAEELVNFNGMFSGLSTMLTSLITMGIAVAGVLVIGYVVYVMWVKPKILDREQKNLKKFGIT